MWSHNAINISPNNRRESFKNEGNQKPPQHPVSPSNSALLGWHKLATTLPSFGSGASVEYFQPCLNGQTKCWQEHLNFGFSTTWGVSLFALKASWRGLTLRESLVQQPKHFRLYLLCGRKHPARAHTYTHTVQWLAFKDELRWLRLAASGKLAYFS